MRLPLVLAGAGVAAALLTSAAVVTVMHDDQIRDCAAAIGDVSTAASAYQDAFARLDRELNQRVGVNASAEQRARSEFDQTSRDLDAARDAFTQLCHYPEPTTSASTPREFP